MHETDNETNATLHERRIGIELEHDTHSVLFSANTSVYPSHGSTKSSRTVKFETRLKIHKLNCITKHVLTENRSSRVNSSDLIKLWHDGGGGGYEMQDRWLGGYEMRTHGLDQRDLISRSNETGSYFVDIEMSK